MTDAINAAVAAGLLVFAAWAVRRGVQALRGAGRVVADAIRRTVPPTEQQTPDTDNDLLIDAALAYYGPAGLERLHDAINQHREEDSL